ncbi:predicted protein [Naegleria gruberi]|uniref:Predicted protein n=1 Tax=Naegleria gruberi TaxID=5762 RepID=D2VQ94_NAEGR|nr:uncharacterized protein NAEGRDRAFT_71069 [Naegleria gruberi]EFC41070.1 predicted protein [Naegleria gruberi]|eukprot:XP_002673814.1 predicted protein [Naegleria gruberi strain NEG-M]
MKRFVSILLIALTLLVFALSFTSEVSAEEQASTLSLYIRKNNKGKYRVKRRNRQNRKVHKYLDTYGKRKGWKRRYGKKRVIRKKIDVYGKKKRNYNRKRRFDTYGKKNRKYRKNRKNRRGGKRNKKFDLYKRK